MVSEKSIKIGIIGGSGIYRIEGLKLIEKIKVETPFGLPSGDVSKFKIENGGENCCFYFLPRHGDSHEYSPSEINYRANIFALKKLGVEYLISVSAVGSLQEGIHPRMFVLPTQFIDWTKGLRKRTFFDEGIVGHVSVANPIDRNLQGKIADICNLCQVSFMVGGSYVCIEGPQFSSKAESAIYRSFNGSVIGMTNIPEAYLAKEAGMAYATIAMVTDYDCWKEEHCTLDEILKVMNDNKLLAEKVILKLIPELTKNPPKYEPENKGAVITKSSKMNLRHKEILKVVLGE